MILSRSASYIAPRLFLHPTHCLQRFPSPCSQSCSNLVLHPQQLELVDVILVGEEKKERDGRANASGSSVGCFAFKSFRRGT